MRDFSDINSARVAFKQLSDRLDRLESQNIDLHGRRVINAGNALDKSDYATLADIISNVAAISIPNNSTSDNIFDTITILKFATFKNPGKADGFIFGQSGSDSLCLSMNLSWTGAAWVLKDATKAGSLIILIPGAVYFYQFPVAGAITEIGHFNSSGFSIVGGNKLFINGIQVLTTQQTDIGIAATPSAITGGTTGNATYLASQITAMLTDLANIKITLDNYKTRHDNARTIVRAHGLTA